VRASGYLCPECMRATPISARSELDSLKKASRWIGYGNVPSPLICTDCLKTRRQQEVAAAKAALQKKEQQITAWLQGVDRKHAGVDYGAIQPRHAFLLSGLLRYAGDAWDGEILCAWEQYQPLLCDIEEDVRSVFEELYNAEWLMPHANSPLDAFSVDQSGEVCVDALRVNWALSPDVHSRPSSSILEFAQTSLQQASPEQLRSIWEWVCMCELRGHFAYCHQTWQFRSRGWTPAVEGNLSQLLSECSLGVAKTLMWKCFKHLASELQKRVRSPQHTYNMLPGSFQRTYDYYRVNGWSIEPWRRRALSQEPIYTSHLFNRLLSGGIVHYNELIGNDFILPTTAHSDVTEVSLPSN
jgi:hypothetical protein